VILNELKKNIGQTKGLWAEEIPSILWGYNCMPQSSTNETPFRLMYGENVMIPIELDEISWRKQVHDKQHNDTNIRGELDTIKEI